MPRSRSRAEDPGAEAEVVEDALIERGVRNRRGGVSAGGRTIPSARSLAADGRGREETAQRATLLNNLAGAAAGAGGPGGGPGALRARPGHPRTAAGPHPPRTPPPASTTWRGLLRVPAQGDKAAARPLLAAGALAIAEERLGVRGIGQTRIFRANLMVCEVALSLGGVARGRRAWGSGQRLEGGHGRASVSWARSWAQTRA